ncbi:hypothetical protein HY489_04890 [Candidatus Woesearchaeota archaeon]|nr:hypothetical protein [Candidatus Woesearchaeota archaeon]
MGVTSKGGADLVRKGEAVIRSNSKVVWDLESCVGALLKMRFSDSAATVLEYAFPSGTEIDYAEGHVAFQTTYDSFSAFSVSLVDAIDSVEGCILEGTELHAASCAVKPFLYQEEHANVVSADGIPAHERLLERRRAEIIRAYEKYEQELSGFPIEIFEKRKYDVPRELFVRARNILLSVSKTHVGSTLRIDNMRILTLGFRKAGNRMFYPLNTYYTEDEASRGFKSQLERYAGGKQNEG